MSDDLYMDLSSADSDEHLMSSDASLDCALLESLFYNEMMRLEDDLVTPTTTAEVNVDLLDVEPIPVSGYSSTITQRLSIADSVASSTITNNNPLDLTSTLDGPTSYSNTALDRSGISIEAQAAIIDDEKRTKLVAQFATLANRLGIDVPPEALSTLLKETASDQMNPSCTTTNTATALNLPIALQNLQQPLVFSDTTKPGAATKLQVVPVVNESLATSTTDTKRPLESSKHQRRANKKPRASDSIERKLATLQAENELLKRHVQTISETNARFRVAQAPKLKALYKNPNASNAEMMACVTEFTELYSDYGRCRQEELQFHLQQLQRLLNPTNFTKMGLYTLGGQQGSDDRKNPIAGLLTKELGITAQQGKKILEQKERIRHVCANLKKVRTWWCAYWFVYRSMARRVSNETCVHFTPWQCLVLLQKLKSLCAQKTKIFSDRMNKCREILEPRQVIQLLMFINNNSDLLGQVCPGWDSERVHAKRTAEKPVSMTGEIAPEAGKPDGK
jgi:hypothetical protein